jgi:small redox-active disulfide protein 2
MSRLVRILVGLGLIAYGVYSGNEWFYLGVIPLITGLVNWCPMEAMFGGCKDGNCANGSCGTSVKEEQSSCCSSDNKETKSSCCATPEEQIAKFTAAPPKKEACCTPKSDGLVIKILGIGCANCVALKKVVDEAIKELGVDAQVLKVEDMNEIMKYQVMSTPGLVINEEVKSAGKLLIKEEVKALINGACEQKGEEVTTKCCGN